MSQRMADERRIDEQQRQKEERREIMKKKACTWYDISTSSAYCRAIVVRTCGTGWANLQQLSVDFLWSAEAAYLQSCHVDLQQHHPKWQLTGQSINTWAQTFVTTSVQSEQDFTSLVHGMLKHVLGSVGEWGRVDNTRVERYRSSQSGANTNRIAARVRAECGLQHTFANDATPEHIQQHIANDIFQTCKGIRALKSRVDQFVGNTSSHRRYLGQFVVEEEPRLGGAFAIHEDVYELVVECERQKRGVIIQALSDVLVSDLVNMVCGFIHFNSLTTA